MPRNERWYENPDWSHPYETCGSSFKTDYDYHYITGIIFMPDAEIIGSIGPIFASWQVDAITHELNRAFRRGYEQALEHMKEDTENG